MTKRRETHDHNCARPGCPATVRKGSLACYKDWNKLPRDIQREVYRHYVPGQTIDTATPEYMTALKRALDFWIHLGQRRAVV